MCFSRNESTEPFVIHFKLVQRVFSDHLKPFFISLLQGQVFSRKWIVRSEKGAIQISLNTIFLYSRIPSMLIFGIFNENESKNTQNVLEMSNYCVSQDKIVDVWNVVLPIIIQIILHFLDFQPSVHTYLTIYTIIFVWYLKTWYIMILKRKIYNGITR